MASKNLQAWREMLARLEMDLVADQENLTRALDFADCAGRRVDATREARNSTCVHVKALEVEFPR